MVSLVTIPDASNGCVFELDCPNSYYAYPRLTEIQKIPGSVKSTLEYLWNKSIHEGRKVRFFEHKNVFVAQEGIVFDQDKNLISESRTYHSEDEIQKALNDINENQIKCDVKTIKKAILTKARGAGNYGHFILEMLPRAWMARSNLNVSDWPVLIHDVGASLTTIMKESLSLAGFDDSRIVVSGTEPVFVENLIVVDGLTSHTQYLSPYVMKCLDEITSGISVEGKSKLYASRGANASRDFADEPDVSKELAALGYVEKFAGAMSFVEQVAAFRDANSVVGVLGAALSNIAFCRPGADVHCFMPSGACEVLFWMLAERRNLRYHEIRCEEEGPQLGPLPWDRQIRLPKNALVSLV